MTNHYNKLIRDNIPDIEEKKGRKVVARRADTDAEYWSRLKEKLQEEINKFGESENIETMADIFEVLNAMIEFKQFDKREVEAIAENKAIDLGRFTKRLILEQSDAELGHPIE